mmetsp:Transcript_13488/g.26528  ORF Transcript_13488/g.26528 Transcript_13488/m.26528 type:complete len:256 (+) Transcript_13488:486-1253(+)
MSQCSKSNVHDRLLTSSSTRPKPRRPPIRACLMGYGMPIGRGKCKLAPKTSTPLQGNATMLMSNLGMYTSSWLTNGDAVSSTTPPVEESLSTAAARELHSPGTLTTGTSALITNVSLSGPSAELPRGQMHDDKLAESSQTSVPCRMIWRSSAARAFSTEWLLMSQTVSFKSHGSNSFNSVPEMVSTTAATSATGLILFCGPGGTIAGVLPCISLSAGNKSEHRGVLKAFVAALTFAEAAVSCAAFHWHRPPLLGG